MPHNDLLLKNENTKKSLLLEGLIPYPKDILLTILIMTSTTLLGLGFHALGITEANIITIYILGVLLTSLFTRGYTCGLISSIMSVFLFNFFFTEPKHTFFAYDSGYAITFAIMLTASVIAGTLASKLKWQVKLSEEAAFRTKVLLNTSQQLQRAQTSDEMLNITATQFLKLLNRPIVIYPVQDDALTEGRLYQSDSSHTEKELLSVQERRVAKWVYKNCRRAGATTSIFSNAKCLYFSIRINKDVFGVVGVYMDGKPLDTFEKDILRSVLGECALALDNARNAKEKEQAAVIAKNEQLRANLLRTISHDLRTPLTSISGNASNLMTNYDKMDETTKMQVFTDIYDDSEWLISVVENLLSVTRLEDGRMNFNMSVHLMDEVIDEAMKHISRKKSEHIISVDYKDEFMLAKIDAKLIIQVIINLVDNAVKYTPKGSEIRISAEKRKNVIAVSVADNGNGIPDEQKPKVFEMFYSGDNKIADSRRSLGLGLPLCRSIINAHGGEITLTDHVPCGSIFTFTVPSEEVNINE